MASVPKFITFEGGEGSGKSTQVARAAACIRRALGVEVVETREPGGAPSADLIRHLLVEGDTKRWQPVSEILLHGAARTEHLACTIRPALARGAWVVSDRFADSTRAYQGHGHGVDSATIEAIHLQTTGGMAPDLTLILDIPVDVGLARSHRRPKQPSSADGTGNGAGDRYERMGRAFHERVREGFLSIAAAEPDRCRVIDADRSKEAVAQAVVQAIETQFGLSPGRG